jgi:hypothetical protein
MVQLARLKFEAADGKEWAFQSPGTERLSSPRVICEQLDAATESKIRIVEGVFGARSATLDI